MVLRDSLQVWEVKVSDLTLSPLYAAGRGTLAGVAAGKGISGRFPRYLRLRPDK